jgi:DNA replication protein DnaC
LIDVIHQLVAAPKLTIINKIGYLMLGREQTNLFVQVVALRCAMGGMILASNLS